jgi:cell fate regulator YaaT (PSP1 superfamily)
MPRKKIIEVKIHSWEKNYFFDPLDKEVKIDDWVIIDTEAGTEAGQITAVKDMESSHLTEPLEQIQKIANLTDLEKIKKIQAQKKDALKICKQFIRKYNLPMKLVDVDYSFDERRMIFAFTAESRVDFRQLVKDLTTQFQKNIRLQQIGIRDEMKEIGGVGPCGRQICCYQFLKDLGNITTDLARLQQVQQRGSDRLSGVCGRLKCCLNYEAEGYREGCKKLPPVDSTVKTDQGEGKVIEWNVIKHSVLVRVDKETIVEKYYGCRACGCSGCQANKYFTKE